jgi:hypothetical protein
MRFRMQTVIMLSFVWKKVPGVNLNPFFDGEDTKKF